MRNTDTLMIVHQGDHGTTMVSLPRDSYVAIPGHGQGKINAAFALGGPKLLTRTVEQATGLRLDHFAEVDFLGFVDVVDALGGVRICVPAGGLRDRKSGADFAAGCREMDGVQALSYVRARYSDPEGDLGRVRRQRQLVSAVADKASSPAVALNPWRAGPFLSASLDAVTVDRRAEVRDLFRLGRGCAARPATRSGR
ncbi:LCP family protein [Streptomyces sp. AD16]|nr:LCP family protein [Streptomyces sp. AD16]